MRIALLGYAGLGGAAGGFFYDRRLVAGLRELGATVDEIDLPWLGFGYARGLASNLLPLPRIDGYDLILQDEIVHPALCLRNRGIRARHIPIVSIVHNLTCVQPRTRRKGLAHVVEGAYLRSVDASIAVCESTRLDIQRISRTNRPVLVAYAGRDHLESGETDGTVSARAREAGPLRLLFAGVVAPHKGLHRLVDAIARLPLGVVTLDVAGNLTDTPDYVASVRAQISAAALSEQVQFHGEMSREPLSVLYRRSHVFVLPSDREAYSLAALDALAFGLPALLPIPGGSSELITNGVDGHLIAPDDIAAWTAAIAPMVNDRGRVAMLGQSALRRHQAHRTWAETARDVYDFCERVIPDTGAQNAPGNMPSRRA